MTRILRKSLAVLWLLTAISTPAWSAEVGEAMPDFAVQTFEGKSISSATLAGKPVMLVFWNTWCDDCLRDLPIIDRMARKFVPRGLEVLAVNTGLNDSEGKARAYWKRYGYGFPTGFDHSFEIGQAFKVRGVPTVFLIDAKGFVRYKSSLPPKDMAERFRELNDK
jgi:thiol-disulfide isomerase/thioredoxin